MPDISQDVRDDYVLNANQAGVIIGRDSQTIRRWYYDKHGFLKDYPDFLVRVPNENRGQFDVLISARVLLKVAQDKGLRIDMDKVEQELSHRPDLVDLFREDAARSSSRPIHSEQERGGDRSPQQPFEIVRDPRDAERIEELKGEREEWKTKAERLQEELSTEKDKRINLLGGLTVFNGFANRMIGAAKRGAVDVRFIPTLPQPDNDGNLIFPDVAEEEPAPPVREPTKIIETTVTQPKRRNWIPWALSGTSLLVAGSIAAYVFLPKLLG